MPTVGPRRHAKLETEGLGGWDHSGPSSCRVCRPSLFGTREELRSRRRPSK